MISIHIFLTDDENRKPLSLFRYRDCDEDGCEVGFGVIVWLFGVSVGREYTHAG
jgi:hypothetical protein